MISHAEKLPRIIKFTVVFIASFLICLLITGVYVKNKNNMEQAQIEQLVLTYSNKVSTVLTKLLYKTQVLSALVIQNNGEIEDFNRVAASIIDDPSIRNVILAPDGIVSDVYPLEGNEAVIGLNYFLEGAGNKEAIDAKTTGQLVLGGPFTLVQGGQALVGRLPVFTKAHNQEAEFWGLVSVTLNYPEALESAELNQLKTQGFAYEIWRINPDDGNRQIIASSDYDYNHSAPYVEMPLSLLNAEWSFRLSPIRMWYQYPETWIFTLIGLILSFLIGFLVLHNHDLISMRNELEDLTYNDPLTGIMNRRGIFRYLEQMILESEKHFILCYMDLDKFKLINDTHGHLAGDMALKHFAQSIKKQLKHRELAARIGGDEFLIVFPDTVEICKIDSFFQQLKKNLDSCPDRNNNIDLVFSVGYAVFPDDGATLDELIAAADHAMYQEKAACHSCTK